MVTSWAWGHMCIVTVRALPGVVCMRQTEALLRKWLMVSLCMCVCEWCECGVCVRVVSVCICVWVVCVWVVCVREVCMRSKCVRLLCLRFCECMLRVRWILHIGALLNRWSVCSVAGKSGWVASATRVPATFPLPLCRVPVVHMCLCMMHVRLNW